MTRALAPAVLTAAARPEAMTEERCAIAELLNDPADEGASLARARVAPGVATRLHRVASDERYVILSGRGRVEAGGLMREVGPGDAVLIPAGTPQRIENTGAEDLIFLCLCTPRFRPEIYEDLETA